MTAIRWVFLDVGGPILDETLLQEHWGRIFREAAGAEGAPCDEELYRRLSAEGIVAYAGSTTEYIAWRLADGDLDRHRRIQKRFWENLRAMSDSDYRRLNPIQSGAAEAIRELSSDYRLGIIANQPARVEGLLREYGVWDHFQVKGISEVIGLFKPEVRLYQAILEKAGASAAESVMIGDRIDNDIVPARLLGMKSVQLKVGRHAEQRPRIPGEIPHRIISRMEDLPEAIRALSETS
ncbi:MAG: HAD family hydrolase [Planctomycetota bacterium]|nr:HAD family hydrolase [Planctomycetota bacterium]